eukprot:3867834-Pyramimonas_sp.AAC.1
MQRPARCGVTTESSRLRWGWVRYNTAAQSGASVSLHHLHRTELSHLIAAQPAEYQERIHPNSYHPGELQPSPLCGPSSVAKRWVFPAAKISCLTRVLIPKTGSAMSQGQPRMRCSNDCWSNPCIVCAYKLSLPQPKEPPSVLDLYPNASFYRISCFLAGEEAVPRDVLPTRDACAVRIVEADIGYVSPEPPRSSSSSANLSGEASAVAAGESSSSAGATTVGGPHWQHERSQVARKRSESSRVAQSNILRSALRLAVISQTHKRLRTPDYCAQSSSYVFKMYLVDGAPANMSTARSAGSPPQLYHQVVFRRLSLAIPRGGLVAVTGTVGSGKSTLLAAVAAAPEVVMFGGRVCVASNGDHTPQGTPSVGYAMQEPWVISGTLRDNILCGSPFDAARYAAILDACELQTDLEAMSDGDLTLVGEQGVMLSGGQRARLALARAAYLPHAYVYCLDDVLSAIDVHVSEKVFRKCICRFMEGTTRFFVTRDDRFIRAADHVLE